MAATIFAVFKNESEAEAAIIELKDLNYDPKDMSIVMKDVRKAEGLKENTGVSVTEGAATGALTGGALVGAAALLVGIGAITLPGFGGLLVGGPVAAALGLTGAAAMTTSGALTGALAGGLVGALAKLGFSKEEAAVYEEEIRAGAILITVPAHDRGAGEVRQILEKHSATGVKELDLPNA